MQGKRLSLKLFSQTAVQQRHEISLHTIFYSCTLTELLLQTVVLRWRKCIFFCSRDTVASICAERSSAKLFEVDPELNQNWTIGHIIKTFGVHVQSFVKNFSPYFWLPFRSFKGCLKGFFGENCNGKCNCTGYERCDSVTGECKRGMYEIKILELG